MALRRAPTSASSTDATWRFSQARIEVEGSELHALDRDPPRRGRPVDCRWLRRPDLDTCEDFDLAATPYTNTRPSTSRPLASVRVEGYGRPGGRCPTSVPSINTRPARAAPTAASTRTAIGNIDSGFTGSSPWMPTGSSSTHGPWARAGERTISQPGAAIWMAAALTTFEVAVCELPAGAVGLGLGRMERSFCHAVARAAPDLLLLNEMPVGSLRFSARADFERRPTCNARWRITRKSLARLEELGARAVVGSCPFFQGDRRVNEAFVWTRERGSRDVHTKQYFPNEEGYYASAPVPRRPTPLRPFRSRRPHRRVPRSVPS